MPARSEAQRRFMFGVMGEKFARAHHFDNKGKLPPRAAKKGKAMKKEGGKHLEAPKLAHGSGSHVGPTTAHAVGHHHKHDGAHKPFRAKAGKAKGGMKNCY